MKSTIIRKSLFTLLVLPFILFHYSCKTTQPEGYQGQGPTAVVSTKTKPILRQWKGIWAFKDSTVFFSNQFDGARLSGVTYDGDNHYTVLITAENTPINPSPWYAFKVWSSIPQTTIIQFTYQNSRNRYYPKISRDGELFYALDSVNYTPLGLGEGEFGIKAAPEMMEIEISTDSLPTWVTAQELYPSERVKKWGDSIAQNEFAKQYSFGKSKEGREMHLLEINESKAKKCILVISRQHPPEVTGFLAMKSFMQTIAGNSDLAKKFRKEYAVFAVPMMNPDGVDNGHWRHNAGGIDLNRDWQAFEQPETSNVRDFIKQKNKEGYKFSFGIDFHSTWDDIYYPLDTTVTGEKGKIVFDWISRISKRVPSKKTNVKPSNELDPTLVSRNFFYKTYQMPAIVFELGDNTPRNLLKKKGEVAAEELMQLLLMQE